MLEVHRQHTSGGVYPKKKRSIRLSSVTSHNGDGPPLWESLVEASLPDPPHDARFETRETHVSNDPPRADKKSPASRHSALSKAGKSPKKRSPVGERLWQRPSSITSPGKDTSSARWDQHEGQVPATFFVMRAWAMSRLSGSSLSHILSPPPTSLSMR